MAIVNLLKNPSADVDLTEIAPDDFALSTIVRVTNQSLRGPASVRGTQTGNNAVFGGVKHTGLSLKSGITYTLLAGIRSSAGFTGGLYVLDMLGNWSQTTTGNVVAADRWTWLRVTFTPNVNDNHLRVNGKRDSGLFVPGNEMHFDAMMLVEGTSVGEYVDGDQPGCAWDGTPHASTSRQKAVRINRVRSPSAEESSITQWSPYGTVGPARSTGWAKVGSHSYRVQGTVVANVGYAAAGMQDLALEKITGGVTYTARIELNEVISSAPFSGIELYFRFWDSASASQTQFQAAGAVGVGEKTLVLTATAPANAVFLQVLVIADVSHLGSDTPVDFSIDKIQVIAESSPSEYFDGDTDRLLTDWSAAPHASVSVSYEEATPSAELFRELSVKGQELLGYLPPFERKDPTIQGTVDVAAREVEKIDGAVTTLKSSAFPDQATDFLHFWEVLVGLEPDPSAFSLAQRRNYVIAYLQRLKHLAEGRFWKERVDEVLGIPFSYVEDSVDDIRELLRDKFDQGSLSVPPWVALQGSAADLVFGDEYFHPSTNSTFRFSRDPGPITDSFAMIRFVAGTNGGSANLAVNLKVLDNSNMIGIGCWSDNNLRIYKYDGGAFTGLNNTAFTLTPGVRYTLLGKVVGNVVTLKLRYLVSGTPTEQTLTYTLLTGNATKFGSGVVGDVAIEMNGLVATNWQIEDFRAGDAGFATPSYVLRVGIPQGDEALTSLVSQLLRDITPAHIEIQAFTTGGFVLGESQLGAQAL